MSGGRSVILTQKGRAICPLAGRYKVPRKVFSLYTSARRHTKTKRRVPTVVFILAAGVIALGAFGWNLWHSWRVQMQPDAAASALSSPSSPSATGKVTAAPADKLGDYIRSLEPRLPGLAYTAPVFDGVTAAKHAPFPSACVASEKRCRCWSEQGTVLYVGDALCRDIVAHGLFRAFDEPVKLQPVNGPTVRQERPQRVVSTEAVPVPNLPDWKHLEISPGPHVAPDEGPPRQKYPPSTVRP